MPRQGSPSEYKLRQREEQQKEFSCGVMHDSIEEAMVHAELNLGFRNSEGKLVVKIEPLLGAMYGAGSVVGWKDGERKRFRVDFDPDYAFKNEEAKKVNHGVNKGTRGVHVNEEDFTRKSRPKVCHATDSGLLMAEHLWRKWSSKYGFRGAITEGHVKNINS